MIEVLWLKRLFISTAWRAAGVALGVALTAALVGALGAFLSASSSVMTARAIAGVPVDWQAQLATGADLGAVERAIRAATPISAIDEVEYGDVRGLSADTGGTVQTTGAGVVVGLPASYSAAFPAEFRPLVGSAHGVLLAQQTAANLHVRVGDVFSVTRTAGRPVSAKVAGIVDLPFADSFFQAIGAVAGPTAQAPPDNVVIVSAATWRRWFASESARSPASVRRQLHVRIAHDLPDDPEAALQLVTSKAHNAELRSAGAVAIGDNLAAQLAGTREDALYARVLFVFLGLPGGILAVLVTIALVASSGDRRRRDAALLRIRGAAASRVAALAVTEGLAIAVLGGLLGFACTPLAVRALANSGEALRASLMWAGLASLSTAIIVLATHLLVLSPTTAAAGVKRVDAGATPAWRRFNLDWILLAVSAVFFWRTAAIGYQVVLAPEGVLQTAVSYDAFAGPVCLWLGASLLSRRLAEGMLARRGTFVEPALALMAGPLASAVAASLGRQRRLVGRGLTLVALAISFAVSTAVFDATYSAQSRVDAQLTNGADVTIVAPFDAGTGRLVDKLKAIRGVQASSAMQRRFVYVGQDLQDLFAIDPATIGNATNISDAYFAGGNARATLDALAATPDAALVSEETVKDFQLSPGDRLNLRLQSARDRKYHVVPFVFAGVAREFPTAPHDSFVVANAAYVTSMTGRGGMVTILLRTATDPAAIAAEAKRMVAAVPGARVSDIGEAIRSTGSSLTAIDVRGLTSLELVFALLLVAGTAGLTLALGFAERRRNFAILTALGATARQLNAFLWAEGIFVLVGGVIFGVVLGVSVAAMLVKVLTGVFDPPPAGLTIPWTYLGALLGLATIAMVAAVVGAGAFVRKDAARELR